MIGIVVVSHSHALAQAAIGLASEMLPSEEGPRLVGAGGLDELTLGTDAAAIAEAIAEADSGDGVLVLLDLGSAVLSAEMAVEFLDPEVAERVIVSPAPLVEGLVAAAVKASGGASVEACDAEARRGLVAKTSHLGDEPRQSEGRERPAEGEWLEFSAAVDTPSGLHARPAALIAAALAELDAEVWARNVSAGGEETEADSAIGLMGLGVGPGEELGVRAQGPDAAAAIKAIEALIADRFGE